MLNDLVEGPESLAEDHTHVDILKVQNSNGHVGTEDENEQDEISEVHHEQCWKLVTLASPGDVFKHEDYADHVENLKRLLREHFADFANDKKGEVKRLMK